MHLTSATAWCLAVVNTPLGRLTWGMPSRMYSDGAHGEQGVDSLNMGCRPVVPLAAYLGPGRPGLSSTYLSILAHHDQGG
jgi:hypothetical protein